MKFEKACDLALRLGGRLLDETELSKLLGMPLPYKPFCCQCGGLLYSVKYVLLESVSEKVLRRAERSPFGGLIGTKPPYTFVGACLQCGRSRPVPERVV